MRVGVYGLKTQGKLTTACTSLQCHPEVPEAGPIVWRLFRTGVTSLYVCKRYPSL